MTCLCRHCVFILTHCAGPMNASRFFTTTLFPNFRLLNPMSTSRTPIDDDPEDGSLPTTRRLEAKIRRLQEDIQHAQGAALASQTRATNWSNPFLRGEIEISPAPLDALINCYPHVPLPTPAEVAGPSFPNAIASSIPTQKELITSLARTSLHQELAAWDRGTDVPPALRHRL